MLLFDTLARQCLEHRDVTSMQSRTAERLRGLVAQHGFTDPTFAYHELRRPASAMQLQTKFGAREPLTGRGLRVMVYVSLHDGSNDTEQGSYSWGYALHVVNTHTAELDSVSHLLCEQEGGRVAALHNGFDPELPVTAHMDHLREQGYFADRGLELGRFMRHVLDHTAP